MIKITVHYGHPSNSEDFEKYCAETHLPLSATMKYVIKLETIKYLNNPDGSKPAYYLATDLYFENLEQLQKNSGSPEGIAAVADIANFATGGFTMMVGIID